LKTNNRLKIQTIKTGFLREMNNGEEREFIISILERY